VPGADVVIEAIFENLEAKQELYARLEPRIEAGGTARDQYLQSHARAPGGEARPPERLVGLHFFNPVPQMPLIEIVYADHTDPAACRPRPALRVASTSCPLPCRSAPGFMVNRVLTPYMHEAMLAAQEGVPLTVIDAAAVSFGMPVGPIELVDVRGARCRRARGRIIARQLGRLFRGAAPERAAGR